MDRETDKRDAAAAADRLSTVRLSVAGQVIHVPWDDLLDPHKWFAARDDRAVGDEG